MAYTDNFPQRPVFMADFANGGRIDPRATFSRSDSPIDATKAAASAVHYWSNEKRLSSENLVAQSSDLGSWSEGSPTYTTVTSNATTAPDGTTTAAQITGLTGTNKKAIYYPVSAGSGSHTGIFFVKPNGHEYVQIMFGGVSTVYQNYHLSSTGTLGNGNNDGASITQMGDWYKITLTSNSLSSATNYYLVLVDNNTASRYSDSTTTSSVYAWGANLSSTGEKVFNPTTTQIHREYAPTLKSVATAGQPRFEYDPATDGQSMGILVEGQSTNLFARSSGFDYTTAWAWTNVTAVAEAISPDGSLNAFAIRENTATATHKIAQAATVGSGSVAFSVHAKLLGNTRRLVLREDSTTGAYATFDLSTGTVAATGDGAISGSIEAVGNGFYRCTMVSSPGAGAKNFAAWLATSTATNYETYTGDGFSGLLLFGAQVEDSSFSSSYIESLGSAGVTRAADSLSVVSSNLFDNGGGTLVVETENVGRAYYAAVLEDDSTSVYQDYVALTVRADNKARQTVNAPGSTGASDEFSAASTVGGSYFKIASRFAPNDFGVCIDGGTVSTDTTGAVPSNVDKLFIGWYDDGGRANAHIKRVAVYGEALSDTNLQALTS